jgi:DNA repair ATPase RecN
LIASVGLAVAAYLHRTRQIRLVAPDLSGAADAALRNLRKAQELTHGLIGSMSTGLKSVPQAIAQETDRLDDPTLASALLQLRAMFARTEAAVATLSATAVVREVMQTELAAIRSRLEEAERAARRGSTPMMKLAAQFRQIARDIDRVQNVTQSASRSLGSQA